MAFGCELRVRDGPALEFAKATGRPSESVTTIDEGDRMDTTIYEPPAMAEAGDFNEITLKQGTWGYDSKDQCLIAC